jgi:hypothetical protein
VCGARGNSLSSPRDFQEEWGTDKEKAGGYNDRLCRIMKWIGGKEDNLDLILQK